MHAISVHSGLPSQCEAQGSLRTVAKQFSENAKDVCDISFYQHSQYTAFYPPNKTEMMIITPGKSVTMGYLKISKTDVKRAVIGQRSKKTEENKHSG